MKKIKPLTAEDIRNLRLELNMTQAEFASELRMMQPVIGRWECGMAQPNRQSMEDLWRLYMRRHRIGMEAEARRQLEKDGYHIISTDPETGSVDLVATNEVGRTRFICLGERPKRKLPFKVETWTFNEDSGFDIKTS